MIDRKRLRDLARAAINGDSSARIIYKAAAHPQTLLALLDALDAAEQPAPDDARNAELGRILLRYIDRLNDPDDECDPLPKIVGELTRAADAAIDAAIQAQEGTP